MVSNTGCKSVGELEMTWRISLVAVCCSRASVTARFRCLAAPRSSRAFSMAITAWSAKVRSRPTCGSGNSPVASRVMLSAPMGTPSRSMGTTIWLRNPRIAPEPRRDRVRVGLHVTDVDDPLLPDRPRDETLAIRRHGVDLGEGLDGCGGEVVVGGEMDQSAVEPIDRPEPSAAQACGVRDDRLEDRLQIRGGTADHPEDLGRRRLLVQRLRQRGVPLLELREEAHVLDGDHRLVGERLEEGELARR